ncbi:haloacid dehalogenase [Clostridia bacterium]|nr:haloacid dehalogenase [Clostridia bacterium]
MTTPKMILFDYGHTLLYEPEQSILRGTEAIMQYALKNPRNLSPKHVNDFAAELHSKTHFLGRAMEMEVPNLCFQRLLYEYLGIEFSISLEEQEQIFFDSCSCGAKMPYVEKTLVYLKAQGIRMGVISNFSISETALKRRIKELLPQSDFEFIIASSAYGIRKPSPVLFELALNKADLLPSDVWYCGDSAKADVDAAAAVGIFPVWYTGEAVETSPWTANEGEPTCEHLHIYDWRELIEILEGVR